MNASTSQSLNNNLDVLSRKWHLLILFHLLAGPRRFNEIKFAVGGTISSKSLSAALKNLTDKGFVVKHQNDDQSLPGHYHLTPKAKLMEGIFRAFQRWDYQIKLEPGQFC